MGGRQGVREKAPRPARLKPEGDQEEAAGNREILEEVPHGLAPLGGTAQAEVGRLPELFEQDGRHRAVAGENEGREPIRNPGEYAERHEELDAETHKDQRLRQVSVGGRLPRLIDGSGKVQDLIQRAERQKQEDQRKPRCEDEKHVDRHGAASCLNRCVHWLKCAARRRRSRRLS